MEPGGVLGCSAGCGFIGERVQDHYESREEFDQFGKEVDL